MAKGTLGTAGLLPKPLTKEGLAKLTRWQQERGHKLCLRRKGAWLSEGQERPLEEGEEYFWGVVALHKSDSREGRRTCPGEHMRWRPP